jgi:hypothetical protein
MKPIKKYAKKHKYYTVSTRLNYYEMLTFRQLQKYYELTPSELIKLLMEIGDQQARESAIWERKIKA